MSKKRLTHLDCEQLAEILENTEISESIDLGTSLVHQGKHVRHGQITIVSTIGERHAMVLPAE